MIAMRPRISNAGKSIRRTRASDGVRVIEAFECFPVMTAGELALCAGIEGEEAATYLLMLEGLGLAETDGENYWLNTVVDAAVRRQ